jgi:hypothetical protein
MKKALIAISLLSVVLVASGAGWLRVGGATVWSDRPTVATAWQRLSVGNGIVPAVPVQVFSDSIREYGPASVTNEAVCTGFWTVNVDGSVMPKADLEAVYATDSAAGRLADCEWDVASDGSIYPKE